MSSFSSIVKKYCTHASTLFISFLFPISCFVCHKKENVSVCTSCLDTVPPSLDAPYPYIYALFLYKHSVIKSIIHHIKYKRRKDIARALVDYIHLDSDILENAFFVPIPMHFIEKQKRGYNHAEYIATLLSKKYNREIHTLLSKKYTEKRQVEEKTRGKRMKAMRDIFDIEKKYLKNKATLELLKRKKVILIDDVTTTGATLEEARKTLFREGYRDVVAITIAH